VHIFNKKIKLKLVFSEKYYSQKGMFNLCNLNVFIKPTEQNKDPKGYAEGHYSKIGPTFQTPSPLVTQNRTNS
jgi:hypothetical protein